MEHHVDELQFIEWWEREGRDIDWRARVDESRADIRSPDSLDDMFCDDCDSFRFRVGVIGEKPVCPHCWDEGGYADQQQLDESIVAAADQSESGPAYAVVGCGKAKKDGTHPARDLYTSPYFAKKREWAEELMDEWLILSGEYGLINSETEIESYDTAVEDIAIGPWLTDIQSTLDTYLDESSEVWVLAGQRYVDAADDDGRTLRHVINTATDGDVRYPFEQTSGIGEQIAWLQECLEKDAAAMPYDLSYGGQSNLSDYG